MSLFQVIAAFLTVMAVVGWANARTLKLPQSVAMLSAGVLLAGVLFAAQSVIGPFWGFDSVRAEILRLDFSEAVLGYMLAFLLFSGGMQVDLGEFNNRRLAITSLATLGVLISTVLVGVGVWGAAALVGIPLTLPWALVFGALISPTDPVAVMANVRSGVLSRRLGAVLQGEALFNDGVGLVAFTAALTFAASGVAPDPGHTAAIIVEAAGGGLLLGLAGGYLVSWFMRVIDDYVVELTASLALAAGVYVLAEMLHVSGSIAAGAAGLVVGSYGVKTAMSEATRAHIQSFWHLADEVLNGLLFLLLGLQIFIVPFDLQEVGLWLAAIALTVLARLIVVLPWGVYFHLRHDERRPSLMLAWGGLRGAISLALALTLPRGEPKPTLLATTFAVVIFSVLIQGLSFGPLARRWHKAEPQP
ncbi:MAG TPA: sodium:proton antiporter [Caulobacteraceae bacterium]|jgi:CPA1 family monovalent cation:H+ antiporter|nr:sodium:proton antiporter [Caulobacteraceae bacterium]